MVMPQLSSLTVRGYRSIKELNEFPLMNLNILTGINGVGKSNFLSFFTLASALERRELQDFVEDQGGADAILFLGSRVTSGISAAFDFGDIGYRFELVPTKENRVAFKSEHSELLDVYSSVQPRLLLGADHGESNLRASSDNYSPTVCRALSQFRVYHFRDLGNLAKDARSIGETGPIVLKEDASNLGAVLWELSKHYPGEYAQIVDTVRHIAPFFDDFAVGEDRYGSVILKWAKEGSTAPLQDLHTLSFGLLRFICLVTLLLLPEKSKAPTILIDELELGIHPMAVRVLAEILSHVSRSTQLIVSTLSAELLNEFEPGKVIMADLAGDASVFRRF